jgi:hypothetical protein
MGWINDWHSKTGNWQPNSTDIHAVWNVKNLGGYISKYMGKKGERLDVSELGFQTPTIPRLLDGKIWGCSENLRGKKRFTCEVDEFTWKKIQAGIAYKEIGVYEMERCVFYTGAGVRELSVKNRNGYEKWML